LYAVEAVLRERCANVRVDLRDVLGMMRARVGDDQIEGNREQGGLRRRSGGVVDLTARMRGKWRNSGT
jgi:hypothetical protein